MAAMQQTRLLPRVAAHPCALRLQAAPAHSAVNATRGCADKCPAVSCLPAGCCVLAATRTLRLRGVAGVNAFCSNTPARKLRGNSCVVRGWTGWGNKHGISPCGMLPQPSIVHSYHTSGPCRLICAKLFVWRSSSAHYQRKQYKSSLAWTDFAGRRTTNANESLLLLLLEPLPLQS